MVFTLGFFLAESIADDVRQQYHLWTFTPCRLGTVIHRAHVALVQVFETGEQHIAATVQVILGLDDGRHRLAEVVAEEFQAHGTRMLRHTV